MQFSKSVHFYAFVFAEQAYCGNGRSARIATPTVQKTVGVAFIYCILYRFVGDNDAFFQKHFRPFGIFARNNRKVF